jgi:monooxygenase
MPDPAASPDAFEREQEHLDVAIVGAGLSGIGAAYHLQSALPGKRYAIFEARAAIGGTWDLFRYPGVRSDSDMFTLGYGFRPWKSAKAIADGEAIRDYINDTAREYGIDRRIRFGRRVVEQRWTIEVEHAGSGEVVRLTAGFLYCCTGYYRYDRGYTPKLPGIELFRGRVVHPQRWPDDLDYADKQVVVIGSGATAVTLVPALARDAAHVTMLQRSPSYVLSLPSEDPIATVVRRVLSERRAHSVLRWKNLLVMMANFQLSRRAPQLMRKVLRTKAKNALPSGYDVDTHFNPRYDPWDQRLCVVPDGDLFEAIGRGHASIVTDHIKSFTASGIQLTSGQELPADVVITSTGLNLLFLGGMQLRVDGRDVDVGHTLTYRGVMLGDVPNLAMAAGYTNASWTLKCDLISEYVTRLLEYMDDHELGQATPRPQRDSGATEPFLNLSSGYIVRSADHWPRQGAGAPWRVYNNYLRDIALLRRGDLHDGMEFACRATRRPDVSELVGAEAAVIR